MIQRIKPLTGVKMKQPQCSVAMHLEIVLFLFCVFLLVLTRAGAQATDIVVWDGEQHSEGVGWVTVNSLAIKSQMVEAHSGNTAIQFTYNGTNSTGWVGAGWDWLGASYPIPVGPYGTDITAMKYFTFWLKVQGTANEMWVNLLCNGAPALDLPQHHTGKITVSKYCAQWNDGQWHRLVIPLTDLVQPAGFDPVHVAEMHLFTSVGAGSFFIDDLTFTDSANLSAGDRAWNFATCEQLGGYQDGQYWWITQDVWGPATNWQQCLYSDSHSHWQITANLKGKQWVGSYPHASYGVGGNQNENGGPKLNHVLNSSTPLMATWNASYPADHKFDFAYDLWLNGTTYEVMIWLNWKDTAPIGIHPFTNAIIDGITYNIYEGVGGSGPHCISFLPQNSMMDTATNFNLCSILSWINNLKWNGGPEGCYWQNPNFDSVQLGWEICDTYGSAKTYTMNYFDVFYGNANTNTTPPPPTVEKLIWQADFDSAFPSGGYGFSDRDGSPSSASGILLTNRTGGVGNTSSFEYSVDLSSWSSRPPASYSGFGVGANENPLPCSLTSSSQASYRVYLSAKVGGTSAGVTSVPANVDLNFFAPVGQVYDLTATCSLSTNWQSFVFDGGTNMQVANWLAGAQQLFNQNVTNVNKMELQITVPGSPNVATMFGYDTNITVDIDNIRVVQLVPELSPLTVLQTNGRTQITRVDPTTDGTAKLQSATNVPGPNINVAGAVSAVASP